MASAVDAVNREHPGHWSRADDFEPVQVPEFTLSDEITEEAATTDGPVTEEQTGPQLDLLEVLQTDDPLHTEESPNHTEESPKGGVRPVAAHLTADWASMVGTPPQSTQPCPQRAALLAAAIAADLDALDIRRTDDDATDTQAARQLDPDTSTRHCGADGPTGHYDSEWHSDPASEVFIASHPAEPRSASFEEVSHARPSSRGAHDESVLEELEIEVSLTLDPPRPKPLSLPPMPSPAAPVGSSFHNASASDPSIGQPSTQRSAIRQSPSDPGSGCAGSGHAPRLPTAAPLATELEDDFPSDWLTDDQVDTVLLPIDDVFGEAGMQALQGPQRARPWSPTQLALLNGLAWAMGFMGMFCTASVVAWTAILVTFALTLPTA